MAALAAASDDGERLVARVRLGAMALLLISPTLKLVLEPSNAIHVWGFVVTATAATAAVVIWWQLRRGRWRPWIGFVSSALDVSLVSTALFTFLLVRRTDLVARYGGEEFVVLFPETGRDDAFAAARAASRTIRCAALPWPSRMLSGGRPR